ncbi:MAG: hypothetical protein WAW61_05995 [Methylococcaceae bacterium]
MQKESIGVIARDALQNSVGKDVLYDTLDREDLDWRKVLMGKPLIKQCGNCRYRVKSLCR